VAFEIFSLAQNSEIVCESSISRRQHEGRYLAAAGKRLPGNQNADSTIQPVSASVWMQEKKNARAGTACAKAGLPEE
jgi:hypothetical protein